MLREKSSAMKFSKRQTPMFAAAIVTVLLVASARAEIIEQILVKVNGEIFTKTDLETRQVAALRQSGQDSDPTDVRLRQLLDEVTPDLMVNVVDEMLIVQRGRELGYKMADDQFKSILDSIKKDNKIESEEAFQAALKQENMTLADLRRNLEKQMIVERVRQNEVLGKIGVNDEEARRYYESHQSEFTSPQTITLREVFVNVAGDGDHHQRRPRRGGARKGGEDPAARASPARASRSSPPISPTLPPGPTPG